MSHLPVKLLPARAVLRARQRRRDGPDQRPQADDGPIAVQARDVLETATEVAIGNFLEPFSLYELPEVVHRLTGGGYTSVHALRALDETSCSILGITGAPTRTLYVSLRGWQH